MDAWHACSNPSAFPASLALVPRRRRSIHPPTHPPTPPATYIHTSVLWCCCELPAGMGTTKPCATAARPRTRSVVFIFSLCRWSG